ncbi:MAG: HAMP domain-containing histidine kinase [Candidatus Liptonbacteria bacterium]|nr:HAMP domain-containing histidine kinase [Candidatus Liptonbacteria bacterium]
MPNLKFFLLSFLPAAGAILISFFFLPPVWFVTATILIVILLGLSFAPTVLSGMQKAELPVDEQTGDVELQSILNNFGDALLIYDENFKVIFFNIAAEKLFSVPSELAIGITIRPEFVDDPKLKVLTRVVFPTLSPIMIPRSPAGTWPQIVDLSFSEPQLDLRVSTSQLARESGGPTRFLKIIQNRTHEVELLKIKSDFVTVASHQLKTPLTNINWALESLKKDNTLNNSDKEIVESAFEASKFLSEIVESLLNIAKIEEGRFGYDFQRADIVEFLNRILGQALTQANKAGVRIYFDKPKTALPPVFIDEKRLTLAVANILDNAIRYNVKNGEVIVKAAPADGKPFVEVSIKDTGIGIPQEEMSKLFSKFFRAENAIKFQTEGTGLGLYISKNIVEAHGGEIRVESEINRGTTFYFTLPTDESLVPKKEIPQEG